MLKVKGQTVTRRHKHALKFLDSAEEASKGCKIIQRTTSGKSWLLDLPNNENRTTTKYVKREGIMRYG